MSFRTLVTVPLKEHLLAYALASISNLLLLVPQSQFARRAGLGFDALISAALFQLFIGVLLVLLTLSGTIRRGWKWEYTVVGSLFAGYVGYRLSTRFVAGLEAISILAARGASVSGDVRALYLYGLGSALSYMGVILAMRRAYNGLATFKAMDDRPVGDRSGLVEIPERSSSGEGHYKRALVANHQGDLVGGEAPLAVHLSFFLGKTCTTA